MRVVIIGSGNVATVFGRLLKDARHEIVQVVSRNEANAKLLATELGCSFANIHGLVDRGADIYIVAVIDSALHELSEFLQLGDRLVVHTAGSVSKDILKNVSLHYGVLYPLQSLRKEFIEIKQEIPLLIDGNSDEAIEQIRDLGKTISNSVAFAPDLERLKLHIAGVVVNNFTNHLYSIAFDYCAAEKVDFKMLQPLIEDTALRLRYFSPKDVQTGPAVRKDVTTLDKHLRLLSSHPRLKMLYLRMTDSIMNP